MGENYNKESGSIQVKLYLSPHELHPPQKLRLLVYDDQRFSWPGLSRFNYYYAASIKNLMTMSDLFL